MTAISLASLNFTGKTVATVNKTEQKLQDFKEDLAAGKRLPHHHEHPGFEVSSYSSADVAMR